MLATGIPRSFARNWKVVNSLMSSVFPQRRECGANHQTSTSSSLPGARRSIDALRLWKTAADVRAGRGGPSEELEEDSLAARHKRMAGIALRGLTSTTFSWLRPWATTAQGSLVTERMARVGKGTDQVLPL